MRRVALYLILEESGLPWMFACADPMLQPVARLHSQGLYDELGAGLLSYSGSAQLCAPLL